MNGKRAGCAVAARYRPTVDRLLRSDSDTFFKLNQRRIAPEAPLKSW